MIERGDGEERHKFRMITIPAAVREVEGADDAEKDYFKSIERDFEDTAGEVLERLNLSHLRRDIKK
ncbi:MAG TPA: hypothetical protein VMC84_08170 [Methanocella sp.]|uniref:hypothetical protein n=1 Tax=Methanocella sp. TaxID=2052833 RepID=UPI002CF88976|nr:hypothetical protein [Methanocella sp.]HTY91134.1 hypothetical protein [Methanocella sp.]